MKLIQNICLAFLTGSIIILSSCGAQKPSVIAAEKAYNAEKYFIAADLYKKAIPTIRNKKTKAELIYKVAESIVRLTTPNNLLFGMRKQLLLDMKVLMFI